MQQSAPVSPPAPRFDPGAVRKVVRDVATKVGVSPADAEVFADALVDADVHGTSTHGVSRLNIYVRRIQKGLIDPAAELAIDRESPGTLALDARNGLGQVQAVKALRMLRPKAVANGVAAATIRRSQHFGALSYYCNKAAGHGQILIATTNCEPAMSPSGGCDAFFGTNPIAASFPTGMEQPIKIDLATSIIARGNIIAANKRGAAIPSGWALDGKGEPTTDAAAALNGTVLTMAGHKGYALALMVEMLSGVLSGSAVGSDVGSMYKNMDRPQDVGHFFVLIDVGAFMDTGEFERRTADAISKLKSGRRRPGVDEILIPGERSGRVAKQSRESGITIEPVTLQEIETLCGELGVPFQLETLG